ncbi:DUF2304 domain-containing protein [Blautia marasmi]|uniref:DUF2304 domain-containing protein n=1 Tax=Blautia marasmi TaxID=1917868 RepID=UPI000CF1CF4D|nr:DUF2304 domain-containing protein [Blautia marasmi]
MNIKTQILVAAVVFLSLGILINLIRKNKLELKYALLWFLLGIGVLIFDCFPSLTSWLAKTFGIGQAVNLLFFAGFCFALLIIFSLTTAVSRLSVKVKRLTQEIALLEKQVNHKEGTGQEPDAEREDRYEGKC